MDEQVRRAIEEHEDYQRLKGIFTLDFLVGCFQNVTERWVGALLRDHGSNPTLFVSGFHYHELIELEELRKLGYSDEQLRICNPDDTNHYSADTVAKKKEFEFYQHVSDAVEGVRPPFLAWSFSHLAVFSDFGIWIPPFALFYRMIEERGSDFYDEPFTIQDVETCIGILKIGGDSCSGEQTALDYARQCLSGRKPAPEIRPPFNPEIEAWM